MSFSAQPHRLVLTLSVPLSWLTFFVSSFVFKKSPKKKSPNSCFGYFSSIIQLSQQEVSPVWRRLIVNDVAYQKRFTVGASDPSHILEVVWNVIPIRFLKLRWHADTQIRFQSVIWVTCNATPVKSRVKWIKEAEQSREDNTKKSLLTGTEIYCLAVLQCWKAVCSYLHCYRINPCRWISDVRTHKSDRITYE